MSFLIAATLMIAALSGTLVVWTRDPKRQLFTIAANGLVLSTLFFVLQAPDVSLSEIAVGTVITPFLFLVTLAAVAMNKNPS